MDILIIRKRADSVVNGFTTAKTINASDTLKVIAELERTAAAYERLEKAFKAAQAALEELNKPKSDKTDFSFETLFKDSLNTSYKPKY